MYLDICDPIDRQPRHPTPAIDTPRTPTPVIDPLPHDPIVPQVPIPVIDPSLLPHGPIVTPAIVPQLALPPRYPTPPRPKPRPKTKSTANPNPNAQEEDLGLTKRASKRKLDIYLAAEEKIEAGKKKKDAKRPRKK